MKKLLALAFALWASCAAAQDIPNHTIPIGRGPGSAGWGSVSTAGAVAGYVLTYNGASSDPTWQAGGGGGGGVTSCSPTAPLTCSVVAAVLNVAIGLTTDFTTSGGNLVLSTVNANVGSFGTTTRCPSITVNGKGLITAASDAVCAPAASSITGAGNITSGNDTNVTLTLGGTPTGSVLTGAGVSFAMGWTGTLATSRGGCGAAVTPSNGGVMWTNASNCAVVAGTATANLPLLSGSSATPAWAAISYPTSANSGGIPYFSSASAISSSGALTQHALVVGGGAGAMPLTIGTGSANNVLISNGASSDPSWASVSAAIDAAICSTQGDVLYRSASAWSCLATNTDGFVLTTHGAGANPTWTNPASGGTVTTITAGSGIALSSGATCTTTCTVSLTTGRLTAATVSVCGSGVTCDNASHTYTTPSNAIRLEVYFCGGGGGGGGVTQTGTHVAGSAGNTTTFNSVTAVGGSGAGSGTLGPGGNGGTGGTGTAVLRIRGTPGSAGVFGNATLGSAAGNGGGTAFFGGGGQGGGINSGSTSAGGDNGSANTGAGGGGAYDGSSNFLAGGGGGGGECVYNLITSPAGSYTYTVGTGGSGGSGGNGTGGNGATGQLMINEYYN